MRILGISVVAAILFFYMKGKQNQTSTSTTNNNSPTNGFTNFFDNLFGVGKGSGEATLVPNHFLTQGKMATNCPENRTIFGSKPKLYNEL